MRHRRSRSGFTLVELMVVVAIVGVLAALAIYGVNKHLHSAKSAEAKQTVGAIARTAVLAFERERAQSEMLGGGAQSAATSLSLCDTANPVPASVLSVKGKKYQPGTAPGQDFESGSATAGWTCLGFSLSTPISYRYTYIKGGPYIAGPAIGAPDPGSDGFEAAAQGDQNGDGVLSTFQRVGSVNQTTKMIRLSTQVFAHNEHQ